MENSNTKLEQALIYRDLGWSVIPVGVDKKPLIRWEEFQSRIASIDEIQSWFNQWPDANIGIVTGSISNLTVVDIDPRHGGSNEQFKDFQTPNVRTGGDGWHYYFTSDLAIKNKAGILPGIDVRGEGGYVIAPPSVHPTGKAYEWILLPHDISLMEFPDWILRDEDKKQNNNDWQRVLLGVSEGERNTSATRVIGKLLSVFHPDEWYPFVFPLISDWNAQNNPPLPLSELKATFDSLAEKERLNRGEDSVSQSHLYRDGRAMLWKEPVLISSLSTERTPIQWIWEGFLAKGQSTLLSSLWKAGKTTLICLLLKSIENQNQFLGKDTKKVNVLIISEESEAIWAERKEQYGLGENIWLSCRPLSRKTHIQQWTEFLSNTAEFCESNNIELVITDTLATFWSVRDENDASQVTSTLLPLNELQEKQIALLVVHHERKSGGEEGTASRGSGALPAFVDIIMEFRRFDPTKRDDSRRIIRTYSRYEETPSELVIGLHENGYEVHGTKAQVLQQEKFSTFLNVIPETPDSISVELILKDWPEEYGKVPHKATIHRWLLKLKEQGRVDILGKSPEGADLWGKSVASHGSPYIDAKEEAI